MSDMPHIQREGHLSFRDGKDSRDNPYDRTIQVDEHYAWNYGWFDAYYSWQEQITDGIR